MKNIGADWVVRMIWLMALGLTVSGEAADGPVRIEISVAGKIRVGEPVSLTIKYTNTSDEEVELHANGSPARGGFPGETFEVTTKSGKKTYTVFAVDPLPLGKMIKPGKSWTRTIRDLAPVLSGSGILIDGKHPKPGDPPPDLFARPGECKIRVLFDSTVKNTPGVFTGKLKSNLATFDLVSR